MKRIVLTAAALVAVTCAIAAWSQGGRPGGHMMSCPAMAARPPHANMVDRMAQSLELSKDQTAKLKKAVASSDKKLQPLQEQAAKSTQALRAALLAPKYSAKSAKDLAVRAERAESAVATASIDAWTSVRAILTESQAKKLQGMMSMHGPGQMPAGSRPSMPPARTK